ncbi:amidohydrolase [Bradyrhizobium sp. CCGUVB14]|uniref:amidohydrolase family protein n=1 Tax=Bradyrhizobium sp. CCGUVB14 TaxID=2949628 RepID=UPI002113F873|nr:amidohydrolase family protein [Bradyrhizobium sp. CCGUVB14]
MRVGTSIPQVCLAPFQPRAPQRVRVPRGAWDTHTHVIGTPPEYPWVSPRNYNPPSASREDYISHLDALGIDYGVLVQISVHGIDNRALVEALTAYPDRLRGIAVVTPTVSDEELDTLNAAGVRGVRVVTLVAGGVGLETVRPLAERIAPFNWHLQIATDGATLATIEPMLKALPVTVVLDHFGGCDPAEGIEGTGFRALRRLVDAGAFVKLSGAYRLTEPPWDAIAPLARQLIAAAPDRLVWASDWPHVAISDSKLMPRTEATLDLLQHWTEDEVIQRRILVENPVKLYGLPG